MIVSIWHTTNEILYIFKTVYRNVFVLVIQRTLKHSGSLMLWGGFVVGCSGALLKLDSVMNSASRIFQPRTWKRLPGGSDLVMDRALNKMMS